MMVNDQKTIFTDNFAIQYTDQQNFKVSEFFTQFTDYPEHHPYIKVFEESFMYLKNSNLSLLKIFFQNYVKYFFIFFKVKIGWLKNLRKYASVVLRFHGNWSPANNKQLGTAQFGGNRRAQQSTGKLLNLKNCDFNIIDYTTKLKYSRFFS